MKKSLCALLFGVAMAAALTGCGGNSSSGSASSAGGTETSSSASAGTDSSADGKVLKYVMSKEPETLDPNMNNYSTSSSVLQNLFTGLMQVGADGKLINGCAEKYDVSDDGLTYTFTLRDGLKWSDGSDLTAGDFEYAWKRALNPETASPGVAYLYYVKNGQAYNEGNATADEVGVKAVDDKTLEVTLENPTAYFPDLTAVTVYFPTKKDVVENSTPWTKSADTYVCNGAFRLKEINPQESYILEKNPEYYDADNVKLDGVDIIFIESAEAALSAYNAGEVDVLDNAVLGTQARSQYDGSDELQSYDLIGTRYYDFNCSKDYLSDARVRKALSMALNREVITQTIEASKPEPAYAFVPHGINYEGSDKDFRDTVGNLFEENVDEAKSLMAEAGYPDGEGFPTLTLITQNDQEQKDMAQAMQAMWKDNLGVNAEITTYESKVYWDEQRNGNFDICYDGWVGDYPDASTNLECFTLTKNDYQCRWLNDDAQKYNDMLMEARSLADNTKRMELFTDAEKLLIDEMPIIPLNYRNAQLLVKPNCKNVLKTYIGHTLLKYADKE
ncbi:peptide ABC transporter substrate-binding protein [Brotaphodocola sp.]|uniref:peptide ABC transporter substrate-binding protein n=1 Tax=Brotaphodocola sp. TaxID=3073577 RepID=UPI003D7C40AC